MIKPGRVFWEKSSGNPWRFTVVHPVYGEKAHAATFGSASEAKKAMRDFVKKFNEAANKKGLSQ